MQFICYEIVSDIIIWQMYAYIFTPVIATKSGQRQSKRSTDCLKISTIYQTNVHTAEGIVRDLINLALEGFVQDLTLFRCRQKSPMFEKCILMVVQSTDITPK